MIHRLRALASGLIVPGVLLLFLGLSAALEFTLAGMLASVAAIAALLYAGAVRARSAPADPVPTGQMPLVVFDRSLRIVAGPGAGRPVAEQFPPPMRSVIERCCAAALGGTAVRFTGPGTGPSTDYEVVPVRSADGTVVFGMIVPAGSASPLAAMGA